MALNINLSKKVFIEDIMNHFAQVPGGASITHRKAKIILIGLANDLAYLGAMPMRLKNLKPEAVNKLVNYWQQKNLNPRTIKNRLAVLRKIISVLEYPFDIPTNKELNVITKTKKLNIKQKLIDPYAITLYPAFLIREICIMQYCFGLKLYEAIRFDSSMIHDSQIEVSRSISFNNKDRFVPIILSEQEAFIARFKTELKSLLPIPRKEYLCFMTLYRDMQRKLEITHNDYFRNCYIQRRYQDLIKIHDELKALEIIKTEVGYSRVDQVKGVLVCQERF